MYYQLKCFHCKKPPVEEVVLKRVNLIEVLKWLENNEPNFNRRMVWTKLSYQIASNNTVTSLYFDDKEPNQALLLKHYPEANEHQWVISW